MCLCVGLPYSRKASVESGRRLLHLGWIHIRSVCGTLRYVCAPIMHVQFCNVINTSTHKCELFMAWFSWRSGSVDLWLVDLP